MRYYLGGEARLRRSVVDSAMSVFEGWGYEEILTPTIDYYSLFEQGMGASEAESGFRFTDNDGRMLSLRPDVTSSIARVAATLLVEQERPLRFCYSSPVFRRQQRSHAEWRRETTQLGCELIGSDSIAADLEVLLVATEILNQVGLADSFCITINDVEVFNALLNELSFDNSWREQLRKLIDTRDQAELGRFLGSSSVPAQLNSSFCELTKLIGKGEVFERARSKILNQASLNAVSKLENLWTVIESLSLQNVFEVDLADVSSLDYYTGLSFKIFVRGVGYRVGRGGRYDGLTSSFGRPEPAVGFVLNLDSLVEVLGRSPFGNGKPGSRTSLLKSRDLVSTFQEALKRRSNNDQIRID